MAKKDSKIKGVAKAVKEKKEFLLYQDAEEGERMTKFCDDFITNNITSFSYEAVVFGDKKSISISLPQVLEYTSLSAIAKSIIKFDEDPTGSNFGTLVSTLYANLMAFTSVIQNNDQGLVLLLESDISLLYILAITFFPEKLNIVEEIVLKGLDNRKNARENNIREMKGSYGRDSILYLAHWLAKEYNRDENVVKSLLSYCQDRIDPVYVSAIENAYSTNDDTVAKWVDELAEYHVSKSKTSDLTYPFHVNHWIYFPVEILAMVKMRATKKLNNSSISHPLINAFLPFYQEKITLDNDTARLFQKLFTQSGAVPHTIG